MAQQDDRTISPKLQWSYGFGSMFCTGPNSNFINYLFLIFMTDVAKIPTAMAATAYTICSIIRPINIFASGVLIDGTNLRWGKYRSWNIIAITGTLIVSGALFIPYNFSNKLVWAIVCVFFYTLSTFCYNINWTAHRSLVSLMGKTSTDNKSLVSAANVCAQASGFLYGICGTYVLAWFASSKAQYALAEYTWAVLAFIGGIIIFVISKPYDKPNAEIVSEKEKSEKVSVLEMFKTFKGPGTILFIGSTLACVQQGFFTTLLAYFTTYVLNDPKAMGYAVAVNYAGGVVGSILMPKLTKGISNKKIYIFGLISTSLCYVAMYFFGRTGIGFLTIRFIIGCCGAATSGVALPSLGNDLADYYEMRGESRARGFVQSTWGTSIYVGSFISSAIGSYGLAALGYEEGVEMTERLINAICVMMAIGPAIVCALAAIVISLLRINEAELAEYRKNRG